MSNVLMDLSNAMAEAAEKVGASTVKVSARRRMPASGIAYAKDLILTANHVVERDDNITVGLADGKEVTAVIAGRDNGRDLALLRLEKPLASPARTTSEVKVGQLVLALGRPSDEGIEASLGVISMVGGPVHTRHGAIDRYIRTDTTPFPGFSGGPLADAEGNVVGLNTSGFGHGVSITIPADLAWKAAEQLAKHGSIRRGYLGIRSQEVEIPAAAQEALKRKQAYGLILIGVEKNSPAESASMMVGDIIVGMDGQMIENHDELMSNLTGERIGKSTPIEILRGGKLQSLKVTIGARE